MPPSTPWIGHSSQPASLGSCQWGRVLRINSTSPCFLAERSHLFPNALRYPSRWMSVDQSQLEIIMRLSQITIKALNHLANVDRHVGVLSSGNVLAARTPAVLAQATIEETFPPGFIIGDVHDFIRKARLFQNPV